MEQPIACSLDGAAATTQLDEWRSLLARIVTGVRRASATQATMTLAADPGALSDLIDLARREAACCPFFRFAVEIDAMGISLVASVPEEAVVILDGFLGLAP